MDQQAHWQQVYATKATDAVSWYRPHLDRSLAFIDALGLDRDAPILDVGADASTLVDDLLARGFRELTLNDLADTALALARQRLASSPLALNVRYRVGDITTLDLPDAHVALWHDRAVFHFLTTQAERSRYRAQLLHALAPEGWLVLGTFAEDGPERCSGLPVARWSSEALAAEFAPQFRLVHAERQCHRTPRGAEQRFSWCLLRRAAA